MRALSRKLTVLTAAGYLLAVSTASLFHHHADQDGGGCCHGQSLAHGALDDHSPPSKVPSDHSPGSLSDSNCSVCQFLAQKPAPVALIAPVDSGTLVQGVAEPAPVRVVAVLFTAWHSRAPPVPA